MNFVTARWLMKNLLMRKNERILGRSRELMITNLRILYADNEQLSIPLEQLRSAQVRKQRKPWILFVAILLVSLAVIMGQLALYPLVVSGGVLAVTTLGCYCCMKEEVLNLRFSDRSLCVPTEELTTNAYHLAGALEMARFQIQLALAKHQGNAAPAVRISA